MWATQKQTLVPAIASIYLGGREFQGILLGELGNVTGKGRWVIQEV